MNPLPNELIPQLQLLNSTQLAWLSGYCWAQSSHNNDFQADLDSPSTSVADLALPSVHIISASQTGNARKVATTLHQRLQASGIDAKLSTASDYKPKLLATEQIILFITSTQGEGEPPEEAISLYKFLHSKKAPNLAGLQFAVLGLGDSSYPQFCGAAHIFDERLAELGAKRLTERVDCDLQFQAASDKWIADIIPLLKEKVTVSGAKQPSCETLNTINVCQFNKENPFPATLSVRQKITGRNSDKDVRHIELDISGSGLHYQAGDSLGVWFQNDPTLVDKILVGVALSGDETVNINGIEKSIRTALINDLEITQNTPQFMQGYSALANNNELKEILTSTPNFATTHPIAAIIQRYPTALTAQQLFELLRPLSPRMYSIASALEEVGDEVHLTVGVLNYYCDDTHYQGGASSFLAERLKEDDKVRIFVEPNPSFKLPENEATPIIMIGAGTGIAPFRAFIQQRAATSSSGKNWLIFGNPHFSEDFLYQTEWQQFAKEGFLHTYSFAWSRDQQEKIYVQHKIRENAQQLWQWIQEGAHIYVCGDASKMAKDVEHALLDIIIEQGGFSVDDADEYLDELRQQKRYQRDVY